jgi:RimJ/RimL family protein N-acetyltransferase
MSFVQPVSLCAYGVLLEPLTLAHESGLRQAAADGELWTLRVTSVPEPEHTQAYIETALRMQQEGTRVPFAVLEHNTGRVLGCTSYHDIVPAVQRLEIGYTWYAKSAQRTHVNSACKFLLMTHAFDTLGWHVVGWRTDHLNLTSQQAIERLGAHKDGIIRGQALRRDGSIRDTVMYSMLSNEWPAAKMHLTERLKRLTSIPERCPC